MARYSKNRILTFLLMILLPVASAWAATESYIQTISGKIKKGDSCTVVDDKFLNMPLASWNQVRHLAIENVITFELRRDTNIYYQSKPFSCTLNITIKYFTSRDETTAKEIDNIDLKVRYDTASGKFYPLTSSYSFKNAYKVTVIVNSISSPEWGKDLPPVFRISNQILVERRYPFDKTKMPDMMISLSGVPLHSVDSLMSAYFSGRFTAANGPVMPKFRIPFAEPIPPPNPNGQLTISLGSSTNTLYDVEWTFIDKMSDIGTSIMNNAAWFDGSQLLNIPGETEEGWMRNNSTRVTVSGLSYTIDLPYVEGFVLTRVRTVSYGDYNIRHTGPWNYLDASPSRSGYTAGVYIAAHQPDLNWQYTASFAEDGKRKEVISYADATLRTRQVVTISNNEVDYTSQKNIAVVGETIYDRMGRATMSILPAPLTNTALQYYPGINKNEAGNAYSRDDITFPNQTTCYLTAADLATTSGASQYYSPNNSFLANSTDYFYAKYIPDAEKKPYSLTEYTPDNTGRIRRQGGVGKTFQIGDGLHATQYFYGKPKGPRDLERLFGAEAGDFSHYEKNMVVDPNGQASISYIDANGKTVATALAGTTPPNLDKLPSAGNGPAASTINQPLIQPTDFVVDGAGLYKSSSTTFTAPFGNTVYHLNYSVSPAQAVPPSPNNTTTFCSNCYYDISLKVINDCGQVVAGNQVITPPFPGSDITCHDNTTPYTGTLDINIDKVGEYTVVYTLKLSEAQIEYQTGYYITNNSSLYTIQHFFEQQLTNIDLKGCYNECSTCVAKLGSLTEFTQKMLDLLDQQKAEKYPDLPESNFNPRSTFITGWIATTYDALYRNCQSIQANCSMGSACEQKKQMMKYDVEPGGQYALYDETALDGNADQVFTDRDVNVPLKNYKTMPEYFTDDKGNQVHAVDDDGNLASSLSEADFIRAYLKHLEWADYFVKFHIEYCSYIWCKDASNPPATNMEASYTFDQNLRQVILTGDQAISAGYYDHSNYQALLSKDPFFSSTGRGYTYKSAMTTNLQNFTAALHLQFTDLSGNALAGKDIISYIDWILYCMPAAGSTSQDYVNSWTSCTPTAVCRSTTREWDLYRNFYLQQKAMYVQMAKQLAYPSCKNCFIGEDGVNTSPSLGITSPVITALTSCNATTSTSGTTCPAYTDFYLQQRNYTTDPTEHTIYCKIWDYEEWIVYSGGTVPRDVKVTVTGTKTVKNSQTGAVTITSSDYDATILAGHSDVAVFYPTHAEPDPPGDPAKVCAEVDWSFQIKNVAPVCSGGDALVSSCTSDPLYASYQGKNRIFNDWVDPNCFYTLGAPYTIDASGKAAESLTAMRQAAKLELDALKRNWVSRLQAVRDEEDDFSGYALTDLSNDKLNDLASKLYNVSLAYINQAPETDMRAVSTLPMVAGTGGAMTQLFSSDGYKNFSEVFTALIPAALIKKGFNEYLLDKPYPYDKIPYETDPPIAEASTTVCSNLGNFQTSWVNSGSALSFPKYLASILGSDYNLTDNQLTDLQNKCAASCSHRYLNEPIYIPVALAADPATHGPLTCSIITARAASFASDFPDLSRADNPRLYKLEFTNYLNKYFGYSLSFDQYDVFKTPCTSSDLVYDQPSAKQDVPDNFLCAGDIIRNVFTQAGIEYENYITIIKRQFRNSYVSNCLAGQASAGMDASYWEYHYTLFYYDRSGNLVKTIPPEGVQVLNDEQINLLEQLTTQDPSSCPVFPASATTDKTTVLNTISSELQAGTAKSIELWLNSTDGSLTRQVRFVTTDQKYMYQIAIANNKLWVELYSLIPGATGAGDISISLTNQAVADLSGQLPLQSWSHLVIESSDGLTGGSMQFYLDGVKLPMMNPGTGPAYPYEWEIAAGYTLPAVDMSTVSQLRLYNQTLTDQQVVDNYKNSCLTPAASVPASLLSAWGRFDIPSLCSNTGTDRTVTAPDKGSLNITANANDVTPHILSDVTNNFTVEFWVKPSNEEIFNVMQASNPLDGLNPHNYVIFPQSGGAATLGTAGMGVSVGTNGVAVFESAENYMPAVLTWQGPLTGWNHVAIVYINKSPRLYINGVLKSMGSTSTKTWVSPSYNLGGGAPGVMVGGLDELRIWNTVRTPSQIQAAASVSITADNAQGLVGYWPMDASNGNVIHDMSCGAHDLALTASAEAWSADVPALTETNYLPYASRIILPNHGLPTNYAYNSLNQVVKQRSPDGGTSESWYDILGRLAISQNAEQKTPANSSNPANRYSYSIYDALGRVTEVGEKINIPIDKPAMDENMARNDADAGTDGSLKNWLTLGSNRQVTVTAYDIKPAWAPSNILQLNLRKRVAATALLSAVANPAQTTDPSVNRQAASYFNYDVDGNVSTLVQENAALVSNESKLVHGTDGLTGFKTIQYDYDLIAGKVNKVMYQPGKWDQFNYYYIYDADNRLVKELTRREGSDWDPTSNLWTTEATYTYYPHGLLARTELGPQVQGLDYAYTLQGWLKGVNGSQLDASVNMSQDSYNQTGNPFKDFAKDAFAFNLGYYQGDYKPIGSDANAFALQYQPPAIGSTALGGKDLFNGNVSNANYAIAKIDNGNSAGYSYRYDQLSRLTAMNRHAIGTGAVSWSNSNIIQDYAETISYDANGNITTYNRNGSSSHGLNMDQLTYGYNVDASGYLVNNKLRNVQDAVTNSPVAYNDLKGRQIDDNYTYDNSGNLVGDDAENIASIKWTVYGKIESITKKDGTTINYGYDPTGLRITKSVYVPATAATTVTHYVRDGKGTTMGVYCYKFSGGSLIPSEGNWLEQNLQGSSRLGVLNPNFKILSTAPLSSDSYASNSALGPIRGTLGLRTYELTNHLSNVLATISDIKIAVASTSNGSVIDHYEPDLVNSQDYYPFGMTMPDRTYVAAGAGNYRYGFNGKENDNEVKGAEEQQDYGMRIYDPRVGRFLSVDPLTAKYPELTPYQFASNRPVDGIDQDGLQWELNTPLLRLRELPAIRFEEMKRRAGSIRAWDGQPNFWGKVRREIDQMQFTNPSAHIGLSVLYGIIDDAHVTYTNVTGGIGVSRHLDNSSASSYKDRVGAGLNTFSLAVGFLTPEPEIDLFKRMGDIGSQGALGEEIFGGNLNQYSKTFKTFDNFAEGTATSVKTLDLGAQTYVENPSRIKSVLNGYIDKIVEFKRYRAGGFTLDESMIQTRELALLVIGKPTNRLGQYFAILSSQRYAATKMVKFTLKSAPTDIFMRLIIAAPKPRPNNSSQ